METTTAETIQTKILCTAVAVPVRPTLSVVPTTDAFLPLGTAMATRTVLTEVMSLKKSARLKEEPVLETYSHVTTVIAFPASTYVMETTIVWTIRTSLQRDSAARELVTLKKSSNAPRTRIGADLCASPKRWDCRFAQNWHA